MIFLDRGDEIVVPLGLVMGGDNGTWYFGGKSADRLWHKSALGIIMEGGGIGLTSVEMLFCINHRNIDPPSEDFMQTALNADSKLIMEHAVMEALRTPGNKIVLRRNLDSLGIGHSKKSWGLRWDSDKHPSRDLPASEIRWYTAEEEFDYNDLFDWVAEVESIGRIAEALVVDEELSVVTYHLSTVDPIGNLKPPTNEDFLKISNYEYSETITGGAFFAKVTDWPVEAIGVPTQGGRQLDWVERELVQFFGDSSNRFEIESYSPGQKNSEIGITNTASLLLNLLKRGLNSRSGFKFGTTWRCYSGSVGLDHAPWLINDPEDEQKTVGVWAKACLISRLASGVNKQWICPVDVGFGDWDFLKISRPPADSRWSNPR